MFFLFDFVTVFLEVCGIYFSKYKVILIYKVIIYKVIYKVIFTKSFTKLFTKLFTIYKVKTVYKSLSIDI